VQHVHPDVPALQFIEPPACECVQRRLCGLRFFKIG
jgi:hypothetical protein